MNAVLNKNTASVRGCRLYVALFPCNECTKLLLQSGIAEVIYFSDKYHDTYVRACCGVADTLMTTSSTLPPHTIIPLQGAHDRGASHAGHGGRGLPLPQARHGLHPAALCRVGPVRPKCYYTN